MRVLANSIVKESPETRMLQGADGHYTVIYGDLGFLKTSNYDEASEYYKACVMKQLETI